MRCCGKCRNFYVFLSEEINSTPVQGLVLQQGALFRYIMNTCSRNFVQALFSLSVAIAATTLPAYAQSKHQVAPGETLYGLSRRYGVSMDRLREANPEIGRASCRERV